MTHILKHSLDIIIENEGGFVNNPDDRGGPTNYGLSKRFLDKYHGRDVSIQEIAELTAEDAREIYTDAFYLKPRLDELPRALRLAVFDCLVHSGESNAIKILQFAINEVHGKTLVKVDGINGSKTIGACYLTDGQELLDALTDCRKDFLSTLVAQDSSQHQFFGGWLNRICKVKHECLKLYGNS